MRALVRLLKLHGWFVASAVISLVAFGWISTQGTGRIFVTEPFGDFYDYQAASLLHGRLDVPLQAVSFEAFAYKGKYYGYFGLTPALLRLPFTALGIGFGQWSRAYMLLYFAATLVAAYLILLHALRLCRANDSPPHPWLVVLLVANAGMGNTLFFLSSRAYVYHEAILCGAALSLWSVWCALRYFSSPGGRWWIAALVLGLLAVHARPPTGLFALTFVGVASCGLILREWRTARAKARPISWLSSRRPITIGLLTIPSVLSFNGVSYLKFETFDACPLQYHVQYSPQFDPKRLARFGGKQFHLVNIPFVFGGYVLRRDFTLTKYFPYLAITPESPTPNFEPAKMDWVEATIAFPYAMTGLWALATIGATAAFFLVRSLRPGIALAWISAVPMSLAMFSAVALAHRYTADFCPLFICSGAFALAMLQTGSPRLLRIGGGIASALTLPALLGTPLLALQTQGERLWGVPEEVRTNYAELRRDADRFFGRENPRGYGTAGFSCRQVDAAFFVWVLQAYLQNPATLPRAVATYERELSTQTFFPEPHFWAAEMYIQHRELGKATRALEQGLLASPNVAKWQARLGELLAAQDRTAEAITHYRAALRLQPNFVAAHNNIGVAYAKLGQLDEAFRHIETAYRLDPNYAEARSNLEKFKAAMNPAK
jgi:hypothetical protein